MMYFKRLIWIYAALILLFPMAASARDYERHDDIIGAPSQYVVKKEDTLYTIAQENDLGITEMLSANPNTDIWLPGEGRKIALPTMHILPAAPRKGIVINLAEFRLYDFDSGEGVASYPIGIGRSGWETPLGQTHITRKRENPVWIPPQSIREEKPDLPKVFPAGPDNPLGTHAMNLNWPGYVIHGTNAPYGIGRRSSHGCIRLYPKDIPRLFAASDVGKSVTVVNQPYKIGWRGDTLLLEVSPTLAQSDAMLLSETPVPQSYPGSLEGDLIARTQGMDIKLDWTVIDQAKRERSGMPVPVGKKQMADKKP